MIMMSIINLRIIVFHSTIIAHRRLSLSLSVCLCGCVVVRVACACEQIFSILHEWTEYLRESFTFQRLFHFYTNSVKCLAKWGRIGRFCRNANHSEWAIQKGPTAQLSIDAKSYEWIGRLMQCIEPRAWAWWLTSSDQGRDKLMKNLNHISIGAVRRHFWQFVSSSNSSQTQFSSFRCSNSC